MSDRTSALARRGYPRRIATRRLIVLAAGAVLMFAAAAVVLPHSPAELRGLVASAGAAAPLIALTSWLVLVPAMFPGTVLAAAGGLAFGAVGGAAIAWTGALAGGLTAFALARTIGREPAQAGLSRFARAERLTALLERRGFTTVLAARLMPGVPASVLHYAAGLSPVRAGAFAAAIAIGAVLRTAPYALLGDGIGSGSAGALLLAGVSIAIGAVTAFALLRRLRLAPSPA